MSDERDLDNRLAELTASLAAERERRLLAEEALRESEERLRLFVEGVTDYAIFLLDPGGRVLHWTAGAEHLLGYRADEVLGETADRFFIPDDLRAGKPEIELKIAAATGRAEDENWLVRKDGSRFWAGGVTTAWRDAAGNLRGFVKIARDETGRKLAEEALRASEARWRTVVHTAFDYILMVDREGTIQFLNRTSPGLLMEQVVGTHLFEYVSPEFHQTIRGTFDQVIRTREPASYEGAGYGPHGALAWYVCRVGPITRDGEIVGFTIVAADISERKRMEEALRLGHQRLELLSATANELLLNDGHHEIFGRLRERMESLLGLEVYFHYLVEPEGHTLRLDAHGGIPERMARDIELLKFGQDVCGSVALEGRSIVVEDVQSATDPMTDLIRSLGISAYASFPLLAHNRLIGTLSFGTCKRARFDPGELTLMRTVGDQIAAAIERNRIAEGLRERTRQQVAVAELGGRALAGLELSELMNESVALVAQTLNVEFCKILELMSHGEALLLRAGVGWKEGLVGQATVGTDLDSQAGYTLLSQEPVIVENLHTETRFHGPPLLFDHGVVSGMSTIIHGRERPFGVLGTHTTRRRRFSTDDIRFLQAVSNILAMGIERKRAEDALRDSHNVLEARVRERTAELVGVNKVLRREMAERERSDRSVRASEERYRRLVEVCPDAIFIHRENQIVFVNGACLRLFGATEPLQLIGKSPFEVHHPDCHPVLEERMRRMLELERPVPLIEAKVIRLDGTVVDVEVAASPFMNRDGMAIQVVLRDITRRKRAEEALREKDHRIREQLTELELLYRTAPVGLCLMDRDMRYLRVNDRLAAINGRPAAEHIGRTPWEIVPKISSPIVAAYRRVFDSGEPILDVEVHGSTQAEPGAERDWLVSYYPIRSEDGTIQRVSAIVLDITERKRVERDLRRQAQIIGQIHDAVIATDLGGYVTLWNRGAERTYGYTEDEAIGKHVSLVYFEEDRLMLADRVIAPLRAKGEQETEVRSRRRTGEAIFVHLSLSMLLDEQGSPYGMIGYALDITERRRAEEALRESEERFRQLAENIREVFWMIDMQGPRQIYISPTYEEVWGRSCASLHERPESWADALHPEDREGIMANVARRIQSGESWDCEYRIVRPDGAVRWIRDRGFPIRDERGEVLRVAGIAEDITERKKADEVRTRLIETIMAAQEEERRRVARELHDGIGQSLTALIVGLQAFEQAPRPEASRAQARTLLEIAASATEEVRRMARGLRPSALDDLGLAAALERFVTEFARTHGIIVDFYAPGLASHRLPSALETAMYRIIQEALTNVAKHARARRVSVIIDQRPSSVQTIVEDDGVGFDVSTLSRPSAGGERLGLASMRERAALLDGSLAIESSAGNGTTICVRLPLRR